MINKKLLAISSIATIISTSSALAKTQGNYFSLDALVSKSESKFEYSNGTVPNPIQKDNAVGVGLSYKYALNTNNFFFAPGVFAELNNVVAQTNVRENAVGVVLLAGSTSEEFKINDRYGLKADIGYDIFNNLAIYATGGVSNINYKYRATNGAVDFRVSDNKIGYFYGGGVSLKLSKEVGISLEYNTQSLDLKLPVDNKITYNEGDKIVSDLQVIKFGLSVNF